jgi:hypothetical protein
LIQAVHERPAKPIQLPHQDTVELSESGIGHETVETRPTRLGSGDHVVVGLDDIPTLASSVVAEFLELQFGVLVGGGDPGISGDLERSPFAELVHELESTSSLASS